MYLDVDNIELKHEIMTKDKRVVRVIIKKGLSRIIDKHKKTVERGINTD